jgi:predicted ester cyclase
LKRAFRDSAKGIDGFREAVLGQRSKFPKAQFSTSIDQSPTNEE